MKNDLDELLKLVLTPREEAGDILNRKILQQVKETEYMGQKRMKKVSVAVVAALFVATTSITAFAAWKHLSAADVAERIGDEKLTKAFIEQMELDEEETGDKGRMNVYGESQSFGGYKVTVLGIASGKELSEYAHISNGEVRDDRTYCAVAIQKEDGTVVDAEHEYFFVSPLISGLNPGLYNAVTLCGNSTRFAENGILYQMLECDNIEYFADRKLYLCVTDTVMYDSSLYDYNEESGDIARNVGYQGLNALFELQLDASKADPVRAQALIDEVNTPSGDGEDEIELPKEMADALEWTGQVTPENIGQYCVRLENTVQTLNVDKEGYFTMKPWLANEEVSDTRGSDGGRFNMAYFFEDNTPGLIIFSGATSGGMEDVILETFTLNEDGTITFAAWVPKEVSLYLP